MGQYTKITIFILGTLKEPSPIFAVWKKKKKKKKKKKNLFEILHGLTRKLIFFL